MVLGYSMLPLGMGLMFQSIDIAVTTSSVVLIVNMILVKKREEKRHAIRFGSEYLAYKERTPFLMPRLGEVFHALRGWRGGYLGLALTPLLGLAVLIGLTYQFPSPSIIYQREITAAIFLIICTLGAMAGFYPGKISGLLKKREAARNESGEGYLGHHPTCGAFSTHVIRLRERIYCSGCIGLVLGALIGFIYTMFSIFSDNQVTAEFTFTIGVVLIVLGVLQHLLDNDRPIIHSTLNMLLVLGVALARSAAHVLNGGLVVDVYALAFTLYIILARIELSQNDHKLICEACGHQCARTYSTVKLNAVRE